MAALFGKAIVITGAGAGLGAAYARHAASCGAAVVTNDIDRTAADRVAAELAAAGARAISVPGDVSNWTFAARLVDACCDAFGGIDGLVNNAGVLRHGDIFAMTEADLRRMLDVNVVGTAACAAAAARRMREARAGAIVNVTSGSQAGDIALGAYGASKGAVATLTYAWALELAEFGVRVNAVSPLAQTSMSAANSAFLARQNAHRPIPLSTLPAPEASAPVVSFLLSDEARAVNGQVVRIAGRQLSLVSHPMIAAPVLDGEWTLDAVRGAFASTLAARQARLGLAQAKEG